MSPKRWLRRAGGPALLANLGTVPNRVSRVRLAGEAWASIAARPGRALLTAAASVLGVGLLVLTLGLSATAERRLADDFDALRATQVLVSPTGPQPPRTGLDELARLAQLAGVVEAGAFIQAAPVAVRASEDPATPQVVADLLHATPGALRAIEANLAAGQLFADWHATERVPVALVGRRVADALGGIIVDGVATVRIGDVPHVVAGIVDGTPRRPTVNDVVIVPLASFGDSSGRSSDGLTPPVGPQGVLEVVIRTAPGAAQTTAAQAPLALAPSNPSLWSGSAPPDPDTLRVGIESGVRSSLLMVAAAVTLVAGLSIANAVHVSVLESTRELGLRRALGATAGEVRLQVFTEATLLGLLGGVAGVSLGVLGLVATAAAQQTPAILPPWTPIFGALVGAAVGTLAGWLPAHRAGRIEPIEAMRTG